MDEVIDTEYWLASELTPPHSGDVKAVLAIGDNLLVSASRDQSVGLWSKNSDGEFELKTLLDGHKAYVNALAYIPAQHEEDDYVVSGGNSALILLHSLTDPRSEAVSCLIGHALNVCSLWFGTSLRRLVSGSWDCTARVWREGGEGWVTDIILEGHEQAVWDAVGIEKGARTGCYLTGSADQRVILWSEKGDMLSIIKGYPEPVRGLAVLSDESSFASACNDGKIRISDFEGNVRGFLRGHQDSVFAITLGAHDTVLSCGEDHTARVWNGGQGQQIASLLHPCQTVWTVSALPNGDMVTGGSDGLIRIWTHDEERMAALDQQRAFQAQVVAAMQSSAHASFGNIIEEPLAVVVDVDVGDDVETLQLSFRSGDDPGSVAESFVRAHGLPASYIERIEEFIIAQFSQPSMRV